MSSLRSPGGQNSQACPSGHSTTAFAAAVAVGALWPRFRIPFWTYALAIGISRIIVTAHFPSDIAVSAAIGTMGALVVRNYFAGRGRVFVFGPDGSVRALPGSSLVRGWRIIAPMLSRGVPHAHR
jgi:membrane-associated phospholipid phosphatase